MKNMLQSIFQRALDLPVEVDPTTVKYGDINAGKEWDSLRHMILCMQIENHYGFIIDIDQVATIKSYADAVNLLKEQGIEP